jgi:SAM-dependent methyltransferase/uncharacterized protein YbaR (Trm112 family)
VSNFLRQHLVCPYDHLPLEWHADQVVCTDGHSFPVVDGTPVMLIPSNGDDHRWIQESLDMARSLAGTSPPPPPADADDPIEPFVREHLGSSCGYMYTGVASKIMSYPIPDFPMPPGQGRAVLDIGCMWGRWTIAATRRGYHAIGIDPGLRAVLTAKRIARKLGVEATYVVGDARNMPFANRSFDAVFSYSVLQHFDKADTRRTLSHAARCLKPGGTCLIQLAQTFGLRQLALQAKRGFRQARHFEIHQWTVPEMKRTFRELIGPTRVRVDGFFNLNPQPRDLPLLPLKSRLMVHTSEALRKLSTYLPPLIYVADSIYVEATATGEHSASPSKAESLASR